MLESVVFLKDLESRGLVIEVSKGVWLRAPPVSISGSKTPGDLLEDGNLTSRWLVVVERLRRKKLRSFLKSVILHIVVISVLNKMYSSTCKVYIDPKHTKEFLTSNFKYLTMSNVASAAFSPLQVPVGSYGSARSIKPILDL